MLIKFSKILPIIFIILFGISFSKYGDAQPTELSELIREHKLKKKKSCERYNGKYEKGHCILPEPKVKKEEILTSEQAECSRVNGEWKKNFPDTCMDSCSFLASQPCGQAISDGCDCGPKRCWYQFRKSTLGTCVKKPIWEGAFSEF